MADASLICEKYFVHSDGTPIILSTGQKEIFNTIATRTPRRTICICPTQYGKSLSVSLGLIPRVALCPEKWCLLAPTEKKARIIMNYVIQHIFDDDMFADQLIIDTSLEKLKRERSKSRLTFRRGGELFILSADSKNKRKAGEALLGFGAANIILDESSLLDDDIYMMAKRMLGGTADNFMFEIGNPFYRNHFHDTWGGTGYKKIFIDYHQALSERRLPPEFIDEMKQGDPELFSILYECKFPPEMATDKKGFMPLLSWSIIEPKIKHIDTEVGKKLLGCDVGGGGGNYTTIVVRGKSFARIAGKFDYKDSTKIADAVVSVAKEEHIHSGDIFIDDNAIGRGVTSYLRKLGLDVVGITGQSTARDIKFYNIRAELYWRMREWFAGDVAIEYCDDIDQLRHIKYQIMQRTGLIQIQSKLDMRKEGIESPDFADALALTFYRKDDVYKPEYDVRILYHPITGVPIGEEMEDNEDLSRYFGR